MQLTGSLTATAAARYDWIRLPLEDLLIASQSGVNYFRRLSPRIGMTWTGGSTTRLQEVYTAVSRGFRAPALVEIGCSNPDAACPLPFALGSDPPLKPVVATTYELGWRTHHNVRGLDVSANVYQTDVQDDIFFVASTVTAGYFQNIGETRRAGIELSFSWAAASGLRFYGNYDYTRATFQTGADLATTRDTAGEVVVPGDWLPMVPDHRANAGFSMPVRAPARGSGGPAVSVGLDGRYVGHQWLRADEANETARLPDYAVFDATLNVTWSALEMRFTVRNLLDRHYANFFFNDTTTRAIRCSGGSPRASLGVSK
jgi:outer membrane receptor protein involved in Fe transport